MLTPAQLRRIAARMREEEPGNYSVMEAFAQPLSMNQVLQLLDVVADELDPVDHETGKLR
jgi:hypothetical protein